MKAPVCRCFRYFHQVFSLIFVIQRLGRQLNERTRCVKIFVNWYNHQQAEWIIYEGGMTNAQI